jgi:hypothetical protein
LWTPDESMGGSKFNMAEFVKFATQG